VTPSPLPVDDGVKKSARFEIFQHCTNQSFAYSAGSQPSQERRSIARATKIAGLIL
jgi:hypothetical protein